MKRIPLLVLALCASAASVAAAADTDIAWIEALPGVTSAVRVQEAGHAKLVYGLEGDAAATLERVLDGLETRGWAVRRSAAASLGITGFQAVRATKGRARLELVLASAGATQSLIVRLYGPAAPPRAARAQAPERGRVVVDLDDVSRQIDCGEGGEVVVNGNDAHLTLEGACDSLAVRGNDNRVDVLGSVRAITLWGNDNRVTWSPEHNPTAPRVENLGDDNEARAVGR